MIEKVLKDVLSLGGRLKKIYSKSMILHSHAKCFPPQETLRLSFSGERTLFQGKTFK